MKSARDYSNADGINRKKGRLEDAKEKGQAQEPEKEEGNGTRRGTGLWTSAGGESGRGEQKSGQLHRSAGEQGILVRGGEGAEGTGAGEDV